MAGSAGLDVFFALVGSLAVSANALAAGYAIHTLTSRSLGIRLSDEQQRRGAEPEF